MCVSTNVFMLLPSYLLTGMLISLVFEIRESLAGGFGLCRIYSYNVQLVMSGTGQADERHFFVCCADAGDEVICHDQTIQHPRRHEGQETIDISLHLRSALLYRDTESIIGFPLIPKGGLVA